MDYVTSIGLDVHARSVTAAAFNPITGEHATGTFRNDALSIAEWILSFERPKVVYESGPTGFVLQRRLGELGIDCIVGAVSKMYRPTSEKKRKNDRTDALFLARMLAARNIVGVWVPDTECESCRNLSRAHDDARIDLQRARQRLSKFLLRHGYVFDEKTPSGERKSSWGSAHLAWMLKIKFEHGADRQTFDYYLSQAREVARYKGELRKLIERHAANPRWKARVDALKCLKGVETLSAFGFVVEAGTFSRFKSAGAFEAWTGLVPSEHTSGEKVSKGPITKAGNKHVRRLLNQSAWTYSRGRSCAKRPSKGQVVDPATRAHAARGIRRLMDKRGELLARGMKSVVANTATARELAGWIWVIGAMTENSQGRGSA